MIYFAYQAQADLMEPLRALALFARDALTVPVPGFGEHPAVRNLSAALEMVSRATLTHARPSFDIASVKVGNRKVSVQEVAALKTPFATLLRFKKDVGRPQPRVLLVAPLSGHFATLLRSTVLTLLPEHDVYITDWHNGRDVPLADGPFGFDEYVDHIIKFLEHLGPGAHVVAVCQPCVQALVAAAVMAEAGNAAQPRSLTLMAGPVDTRVNPTKVNELAKSKPIEWFEKNLIARVPRQHPGADRLVYPGFVQLSAFLSMNMKRHVDAHVEMFREIAGGEADKAQVRKSFYDEYFAVLDLPAEFYLETVRYIFQDHLLPLGKLTWRGRPIDLRAIRRTALLTVEGERDDICAIGQTLAAQDLCASVKPFRKKHHMQPGVGHYGVFSGRKWESQIYPIVRNTILAND